MTANERAMVEKYMKTANTYFEWGCGGSTMMACSLPNIKRVFSADAHKEWVEKVSSAAAAGACSGKELNMQFIDVGEVGMWSYPLIDNLTLWADYPGAIHNAKADRFDVIFIDGRWRVSCLFEALIVADAETVIMIHDFWIRPFYHKILPYVTVIDKADSLIVAKKADIGLTKEFLLHMSKFYISQTH